MVARIDFAEGGAVLPGTDDRLLDMFEDAAVGIQWLDLDGHVLWANRAEREMLGFADDADFVGRHVGEFHVDRDAVERLLRHVGRGAALRNAPARLRRKDGEVRHVVMSCGAYWRDGELAGAHCFTQDVTDRTRDDEEAAAALSAVRRELQVARRIQLSILPKHPPTIPGFEIAGMVRPAAACSGDFLDYLPLTGGATAVALGDVSGHGLGPALVAAQTSTCLRTLTRLCGRIDHLLTEANALVFQATPGESFVSLAMLAVDPVSNALHYVNAGHPPGMLFDAGGNLKAVLESGDLPLAVAPDTQYRLEGPAVLRRGDLVVLASDGLLEAWSDKGDAFGARRLRELLRANCHLPCQQLIEAVYDGVREFSGWEPQHDDMSIIAVRALCGK